MGMGLAASGEMYLVKMVMASFSRPVKQKSNVHHLVMLRDTAKERVIFRVKVQTYRWENRTFVLCVSPFFPTSVDALYKPAVCLKSVSITLCGILSLQRTCM